MSLADQITILNQHIDGCVSLIEAACDNLGMSEHELAEEIAYYEAKIAEYCDRKAAIEVWA